MKDVCFTNDVVTKLMIAHATHPPLWSERWPVFAEGWMGEERESWRGRERERERETRDEGRE